MESRIVKYFKTEKGRLTKMYNKMRERFLNDEKPHINSLCSKEEFLNFAYSDSSNYLYLYENWVKSNFNSKLVPSIDRIDCSKGYSIDNIQFLTRSDNSKKSNVEYKRNPPKAQNKKRVKLQKDSEVIEFKSCKKACDFLGLSRNAVTIAIKHSKLLKGYKCEYIYDIK